VLQKADPKAQERELMWGLFAVAAVGLVLIIRWGLRRMQPKGRGAGKSETDTALRELRRRWSLAKDSDEENVDIETWLENATSSDADSAINRSEQDESDEEKDRS
jgi:hypothetical protein